MWVTVTHMSYLMSLPRVVAGNVRAEMARHGRTTNELAALLNLSRSSVNRRLRNDLEFTLDEIDKVATWLCVPIAALVRRDAEAAALAASSGEGAE